MGSRRLALEWTETRRASFHRLVSALFSLHWVRNGISKRTHPNMSSKWLPFPTNGPKSNASSFRSRPLACRFERERRTSTKGTEKQLRWDGGSLSGSYDRHPSAKISDQIHACNLRGRDARIRRNASHRLARRRHPFPLAREDRFRRVGNGRNREIATGCRARGSLPYEWLVFPCEVDFVGCQESYARDPKATMVDG